MRVTESLSGSKWYVANTQVFAAFAVACTDRNLESF